MTVSGFIAEIGDIGRFDNPRQLQKLAGYAIVANDSGKHNGESRISLPGTETPEVCAIRGCGIAGGGSL